MLILGRREGESIYIGNHIILKLLKIDRNQVQVGIEAPSDMLILREELKTKAKK
jgi:carbon storage regulator